MKCCCVNKWKELSEPARRQLNVFICLTITMSSWVFVIGYKNGQVLNTGEWIFWLSTQHVILFMLFMCTGCVFYCKKDSMECDENEVSAYIYFSHLFLFTGFKIGIEILYQSKWKEHRHLYNTSWLFLFITPFLVLLLTLGFVSFSKLRKYLHHSQDNCNNPEAGQIEAVDYTITEEAELALKLDQPPPHYEDILLADLPNYESLNIKQFMLGHKVFIIDKSFHMTSFRVSDQV